MIGMSSETEKKRGREERSSRPESRVSISSTRTEFVRLVFKAINIDFKAPNINRVRFIFHDPAHVCITSCRRIGHD